MKNAVSFRFQTRDGRTWKTTFETAEETAVYARLARDLRARFIGRAGYIRRVTDTNNYNGTRTVIVTYDNGRGVYTVEA